MSPICSDDRPREDGAVRPAVAGAEDAEPIAMPLLSARAPRSDSCQPAASSAWLTSASAAAFCARGTLRTCQRANCPSAFVAAACSGFMSGCLTLYLPLTCLATSSESLTTSTSSAPSARARSRPSSSPRYSATLFETTPSSSCASSRTSPSGVETTAAAAAGPGLPRAPPSTWTTSFTSASLGVDRRELAGHARAAAVAAGALLAVLGLALRAALGLAPVDDDLHVRVVLVVLDEPLVELRGEFLWDDGVDHRRGNLRVLRREVQLALLVGRGVGDLVGGLELGELGPLGHEAHAGGFVAEVDLEAVPRELPADDDRDDAALGQRRPDRDDRGAEGAGDARDGARVRARVEEVERARHLQVEVRRDRVDVARLARRRGRAVALAVALVLGRGVMVAVLVARVVRGRLAPAAQAREQPARAGVVGAGAHGRVVEALADPALVRRALRAELADVALLAAGQEHVGGLPRQQVSPANIAVHDRGVRADGAASHGGPRVAAAPPSAALRACVRP